MRRESELGIDRTTLAPVTIAQADQRAEAPSRNGHSRVTEVSPFLAPRSESVYASSLRRLSDIVLASALLVLSVPFMLALAVLIRLDSPGGALFHQDRVGRGGRLFRFYKFRTMYIDARDRFPTLYEYTFPPDELECLYFKLPDDPRVTRIGRWLRRSSLDELPNLVNLLLGDVTLVGPRPDIPEMVRYYTLEQMRKLAVKPGITGLAQIHGRCQLRFQETLKYDVEYVERRSLKLDAEIVLRTALAVLTGHGAY